MSVVLVLLWSSQVAEVEQVVHSQVVVAAEGGPEIQILEVGEGRVVPYQEEEGEEEGAEGPVLLYQEGEAPCQEKGVVEVVVVVVLYFVVVIQYLVGAVVVVEEEEEEEQAQNWVEWVESMKWNLA